MSWVRPEPSGPGDVDLGRGLGRVMGEDHLARLRVHVEAGLDAAGDQPWELRRATAAVADGPSVTTCSSVGSRRSARSPCRR